MDPMMVVGLMRASAASVRKKPRQERSARPRLFIPASAAAVGLALIALELVR